MPIVNAIDGKANRNHDHRDNDDNNIAFRPAVAATNFLPCLTGKTVLEYNERMITSEKKQAVIADTARSKNDTGSPEVQAAILTKRIEEVTAHLKQNKHDFMARRGLLQMVGRRKRLLKYLAEHDSKAYLALVKKLGLRK